MNRIGILELQGDFALHHRIFEEMGIGSVSVKLPKHLDGIEGLVIPGGESTTMSLLMDSFNLREPILSFATNYPIMGTCAGLILMATKVHDSRVVPLGLLDISVDRNAYGRQIMSSTEPAQFHFGEESFTVPATLIRAPKIIEVGKNVRVLGKCGEEPLIVLSGHFLGLSFHPEIDGISIFHEILFDSQSKYFWTILNQVHAA